MGGCERVICELQVLMLGLLELWVLLSDREISLLAASSIGILLYLNDAMISPPMCRHETYRHRQCYN
jgi:hypothetical protein